MKCPICDKEFDTNYISRIHIIRGHDMTTEEFKREYPNVPVNKATEKVLEKR